LLIGGIVFSWSALANIWNNNDPFHGLFTFKRSALSAILLVLVLTASMFIERFYCRYLCPLGAVLAITSRFSLFKLKPESELCIACGKCSQPKACPMQVIVTTNPYTDLPHIKPADCIVCYRCVDICRYSALKLSINKKKKPSKDRHPEQTQSF
jgi:polyferredoxin